MPVTSYSTVAGNNNSAPPDGAPEGCAPSAINNILRQIMADLARECQINAVKKLNSVAGTNTITADMDPELASYAAGMMVVLIPANTNSGATTLAIDGLTALDVQKFGGSALVAGDLVAGIPALLVLDTGADDWILMNPVTGSISAANILAALLTVDGAGSGLDADTLDGTGSAGFALATVTGSGSVELTDVSGTVTGTMFHVKTGHETTIYVDGSGILGTSDATGFTITGLAAAARPATGGLLIPTYIRDNGVYRQAFASPQSNGTIFFYDSTGNGTGFTGSGSKGLFAGWSLTYPNI